MEQDVFRLHYEATQARVEEALRERVGQMAATPTCGRRWSTL